MDPDVAHLLNQCDKLKDIIKKLHQECCDLRIQRDLARAQLYESLPAATPEQEEEWRILMEKARFDTVSLADILAELKREKPTIIDVDPKNPADGET